MSLRSVVKVLIIVCCLFTFMVGIFNVDIGVSMLNNNSFFSSLMVVHAEPRVVYHLGMFLVIMSFLALVVLEVVL